ncbi:hypothetical protein [Actinomadura rudentiformis]|uniref:Uncharacterized protein n=1 Tax=Actinomadura rudentiformis TaxID=359158 RepID=A0A6H9YUM8_9ACTN|nr:hypothetical protein [Actinomadura rudentiformis]KAB2352221.1 hypothetical protein F8566_00450 [Actinomadura rudentiformis]
MRLPESAVKTDRLECIRIDDLSEWHRWTSVPGATIGTWQGSDAAEALDLVAALPTGDVMRCFLPGFGLRAYGTDQLFFEIAFCFECHNALVIQPELDNRHDLIGFKADSRRAEDLLSRFRSL